MPSPLFKYLCRTLCLIVASHAANASNAGLSKMQPSDCRARDADSTCATAVAGATLPIAQDTTLYDGPLGGVPANGYTYWGFDFVADQTGQPSPVRPDQFVNRSSVPVTIKLSFTFPSANPCGNDCLPGVEFRVGAGWSKVDPAYVIEGSTVSLSHEFEPGQGFSWVIGLWQSTNPRLTVTVPKGSSPTLAQVGMSPTPNMATPMAATTHLCNCSDETTAPCSDGTYFSNGLLGYWSQKSGNYERAQAFNNCVTSN